MPIEVVKDEETGNLITIVSGRVRGMDTSSPETDIPPDFYPLIQNIDTTKGHIVRQDGSALHTTSFVTDDTQSPLGVGQYQGSTGTDRITWVQQDGDTAYWSGSATVDLGNEGLTSGTTNWFSVVQLGDYLIFSNDVDGNWKYDGTDFLPLGAKIINNTEATTDWALSGTGASGLTTNTSSHAFGTAAITWDAMEANEAHTITYDPTTLDVDDGLLLAKDYTEDDRLGFWFHCDDVSTLDTTNTLVRIETSSGNDFDFPLSAWTDEDGTVITPADNTWHRVEHVISSGTEAGTYDHTSVDNVQFVFDTDGTGGCTIMVDQVYVRYKAADTMPGGQVNAEWKNMLLVGNVGAADDGTAAQASQICYSRSGGPDEYAATANFQVDEDDGSEVTALKGFYNQVFIGKEDSCHSLGGSLAGTTYPDYALELIRVSNEHGVSSHRSVVEVDKKLYFWWRNFIFTYNGTGTEKISAAVDATLTDVDETLLHLIVGAPYHRLQQIWWSYPTDSASSPDLDAVLKYDWLMDGFSTGTGTARDLNALFTANESGANNLISVRAAGRFLLEDSGTTFDTNNITSTFRLPWMSCNLPHMVKYWDRLLFNHITATGTMTVQVRVADHPSGFSAASFATVGSVDMSNPNQAWVNISDISRWIQIQFTTTNVAFELELPIHIWARPVGEWA